MIRLIKFCFSLVLLLVLVVVADRLAARVAGQVVADRIKATQHLTTTPKVTVEGFPFLTQLVAGKYDHVDATAVDIRRDNVRATSITLHLYGVRVKVADLLSQSVKAVPVDHADGSAVLSYADINALAKPEGVTVKGSAAGIVTVSGSVDVAGVEVKGSGQGSVQPVAGGLQVTVSHIKATGLSAVVASALVKKLSFLIPTSSLPFGVTVDSAVADATGVDITVSAKGFSIPVH